ncbi:MAG: NTP transferase domain-containing protein [Actinomycetia bacterium]|nr:NTP transferase domain-containing protein [Actinomycetes bacterium]
MRFDAIVVAGGAGRRLGGLDKPALRIGGRSLLSRALDAVPDAGRVVVVGPTRDEARDPGGERLLWCQERPPGGGPLAGLAAGLPLTSAAILVVLAADLPDIAPAVPALLARLTEPGEPVDAAVLVDATGRRNLLAAAWRHAPLAAALAAAAPVAGRPMRALESLVRLAEVPDPAGWGADCDTWEDVLALRHRLETRCGERTGLA